MGGVGNVVPAFAAWWGIRVKRVVGDGNVVSEQWRRNGVRGRRRDSERKDG